MHAKDLYERLAAGYNYDPMYGELCTERDRLKKENALLRDLCIDMASHLREAERIHGDELLPDGYIARMRELGIEFK